MTLTKRGLSPQDRPMRRLVSFLALAPLTACITVKAPDKPIEINLNINVRQEVIVSLRNDVKDLAKQFPGVF